MFFCHAPSPAYDDIRDDDDKTTMTLTALALVNGGTTTAMATATTWQQNYQLFSGLLPSTYYLLGARKHVLSTVPRTTYHILRAT